MHLFPHYVGDREPTKAVGDFGGVRFPDGVVAIPNAGYDLEPVKVGQGGRYLGKQGAQVDAWMFSPSGAVRRRTIVFGIGHRLIG